MPKPRRRRSLAFTTSVEEMETTAGATREAMSANDGIVTEVTAPDEVWMGGELDCAFDLRITPRSALMITPKATDAMMIAIIERILLLREFMGFEAPFDWNVGRVLGSGRPRYCLPACSVSARGSSRRQPIETNKPTKCFVTILTPSAAER